MLKIKTFSLCRHSNSRQGRFLSAHLDLLDAASSLFPSLRSSYNTEQAEEDLLPAGSSLSMSKADKLVASEDDLAQSETIRDMTDSLQDIQTFGAKVNPDLEMAISDHIDTLDASGGEPSSPLLKEVFSSTKTQGRLGGPEGTPQPLLIICEDPAYCPPPVPSYHHPYRRPHHRPGLTICRDPNNCPGGYRPHSHRPYRIKVCFEPSDISLQFNLFRNQLNQRGPHQPTNHRRQRGRHLRNMDTSRRSRATQPSGDSNSPR